MTARFFDGERIERIEGENLKSLICYAFNNLIKYLKQDVCNILIDINV